MEQTCCHHVVLHCSWFRATDKYPRGSLGPLGKMQNRHFDVGAALEVVLQPVQHWLQPWSWWRLPVKPNRKSNLQRATGCGRPLRVERPRNEAFDDFTLLRCREGLPTHRHKRLEFIGGLPEGLKRDAIITPSVVFMFNWFRILLR